MSDYTFEIGRAARMRDGDDVTLIAMGVMVERALDAADMLAAVGLHARVLNMSTVQPLDDEAVVAAARETGAIVTVEEHSVHGGLGSAVAEVVVAQPPGADEAARHPRGLRPHRVATWILEHFGLDAAGITAAAKEVVKRRGRADLVTGRAILAIDQGTTNTKALLVDESGQIVARAARPLTPRFPRPAWVEQDANDIWRSVVECIDEALQSRPGVDVAAIGISNQRETVVGWERATGKPIGPAVIWQCRRTAPACEELRSRSLGAMLHERTGLTIDPLFSATKMRWLLDQVEDGHARAEGGEIFFGTIDSWLVWNLTGGDVHVTDLSNASRTQLLGLRSLGWDDDLLESVRCTPNHPAQAGAVERNPRPKRRVRPAAHRCADRQPDRRLARSALRPSRLPPRFDQGHLRHGLVAHDANPAACTLGSWSLIHRGLGQRQGGHLRSRRQHPGDRRRRAVAGRAARIAGSGRWSGRAGGTR